MMACGLGGGGQLTLLVGWLVGWLVGRLAFFLGLLFECVEMGRRIDRMRQCGPQTHSKSQPPCQIPRQCDGLTTSTYYTALNPYKRFRVLGIRAKTPKNDIKGISQLSCAHTHTRTHARTHTHTHACTHMHTYPPTSVTCTVTCPHPKHTHTLRGAIAITCMRATTPRHTSHHVQRATTPRHTSHHVHACHHTSHPTPHLPSSVPESSAACLPTATSSVSAS